MFFIAPMLHMRSKQKRLKRMKKSESERHLLGSKAKQQAEGSSSEQQGPVPMCYVESSLAKRVPSNAEA